MRELPRNAALMIIDLQRAIDHPSWGWRNNPAAERNIAALLAAWRARRMPVIHIRHDSVEPDSTYRPGQPLHEFKPEAAPIEAEVVIGKRTNSAFIGTDLERRLRAARCEVLAVSGATTNNSVEATVPMAGNLGFETYLAADACFTFGRRDWAGNWRSADEVHSLSLANLDREYCSVVTAAALLAALPAT